MLLLLLTLAAFWHTIRVTSKLFFKKLFLSNITHTLYTLYNPCFLLAAFLWRLHLSILLFIDLFFSYRSFFICILWLIHKICEGSLQSWPQAVVFPLPAPLFTCTMKIPASSLLAARKWNLLEKAISFSIMQHFQPVK